MITHSNGKRTKLSLKIRLRVNFRENSIHYRWQRRPIIHLDDDPLSFLWFNRTGTRLELSETKWYTIGKPMLHKANQ